MAALASLSDIINRMTGGAGAFEHLFCFKDARVAAAAAAATVTGRWTSMFQYNGHPAGGSAPGAVSAPGRATVGALMQADPGGGRQKWLIGWEGTCTQPLTVMLYDRLLHISGLSGTNTGAQTVGGALTRYTGSASVGNQIWIEIYTQIGASATTITASYTNQAGVAGQTTLALAIGGSGLREAQRMLQLPLASGDTGVQSVQSVTLNATTGTAGDFGVTVVRPFSTLTFDAEGVGSIRDFINAVPGPIEILTNACLAFAFMANTTTAPQLITGLHSAEA